MKNILILVLLISAFSFGQNVNYDLEDYYYTKRSKYLKIGVVDKNLAIVNEIMEQASYPTSNKLYFANDYIHFDSFTHIEDIEAYTELPNSQERLNVDHFETKDVVGGSVFYSDNRTINFVFPGVTKGATTTLKYKELIDEPHFSNTFSFGSGVPIEHTVFTVEVDKNIELGYTEFNLDQYNISFEKIEGKKTTKYVWNAKDIGAFKSSEKNLSMLEFIPHVIVYIKNYKIGRKKTIIYDELDDLYRWNASLISKIEKSDLTEVHRIADELTNGLTSDREKTHAIFNWVQENINYVAFEYGFGGLIPRDAAQVCNNRYGDCKDMTNLLYEMLNHVGVNAYHTWIGSRDKPYTHAQIPTGSVYDHMITTAEIDGEYLYLDATDSFVPFGMPSSFIQGKEAMIGLAAESYTISTVPIVDKEVNTTQIYTDIKLDGTHLKASGKRILKGYDMVDFLYDFLYDRTDKTDEQFLNEQLIIGNNKAQYSNIEFQEYERTREDNTFSYTVDINDYAKQIGSKIYLNLNLEKPLVNDIVNIENQLYGKKIRHKYDRTYITTFEIPEGFSLKSIPNDIVDEREHYGFSFTFKHNNDKIEVIKEIYMNTIALYNDDLEAYNSFVKSLIKAYKKSIVLEKIN